MKLLIQTPADKCILPTQVMDDQPLVCGTLFFMEEIWKDINGWEGRYQISNLGQVKRLRTEIRGVAKGGREFKTFTAERLTKTYIDRYVCVHLFRDAKLTHKYVHVLLGQAFIPNPDNKPYINHIDGDKTNNALSNLEWATMSENVKHSYEFLNRSRTHHPKGKNHSKARVILQYSLSNEFIKEWGCVSDACKEYNTNHSNIIACCKGRTKKSKGFIWRYK